MTENALFMVKMSDWPRPRCRLIKDTLLEAQKHPEEHTDLIVRAAGYSAYFVDLSRGLQDSIIERSEQAF